MEPASLDPAFTVAVRGPRPDVASSDRDHLVALVGCEGLVVVHTPKATLVMPAAEAQRVKELHALVAERYPGSA
jgi:hypothetical protein